MTDPIQISAYIICKNERGFLGDCLDSLRGFREIVIVDSGSTDGTLELIRDYRARGFPIRLIEREWPGFAAQKQFALEQCAGPWCFGIDADERLSDELRTWLAGFVPGDRAAYAFKRIDYLPGYGYPPPAVHARHHERLVRKDRVRYMLDLRVHEGMIFEGPVEKVAQGRLLHFRNLSVTEEIRKASEYATLKAQDMRERGRRTSFAKMTFRPFGRFIKTYLVQRYVLCGLPGLIYAAEVAFYVFLADAKLYRMSLGAGAPPE
ncbi:MAG: glycosyltransferase family 2 protein [Mesorhizobium sp.]|nr:glycosyltransferase family 2 protein [Mesorhizobium sp.]MCO5162769.1 glycosyltransferase family 2 protein [Mesorhizobium sp.]